MYVIFLFPFVFSLFAAYQFLAGDFRLSTKIIIGLMAAGSIAMQFLPPLPDQVHFLIPLGLQLVICGWWYFASLIDAY